MLHEHLKPPYSSHIHRMNIFFIYTNLTLQIFYNTNFGAETHPTHVPQLRKRSPERHSWEQILNNDVSRITGQRGR